jgi:tetratricopeptide (TPR) repeat protein/formylglycine-generating enzyme required for sulfatase activity
VIFLIVTSCIQHSNLQSPSLTSSSRAALDEATGLDHVVEKLHDEGKFRDAIPLAERSLALREKALGRIHPDVAKSLSNLAELYDAQGVYGKAELLYIRALAIREKTLGSMHPDVATSLDDLGELYRAQGTYDKAKLLLIRALDIREKAMGPMHPDVATSLNDLAAVYWVQRKYDKAEPLYVRALDIREKALGPMHPHVATSLNNLGLLYKYQGKYDKAEPLYQRALDIREEAQGAMHPDVAVSLNNLASLYQAQGAYGRAEPLLVRALDTHEKALGLVHPEVATNLNNLALLYLAQAAYGKAEPLLMRALDINEKLLGPMHPEVANSLDNLAMVYKGQGVYAKAEPLRERALHIREKLLGPMHPDVAISLNNIATVYEDESAYTKAESLYVRALHIHEKALGAMHPSVAISLNNLAGVYQKQGVYAKAEPLYARALHINEKALGAMHPDVATILNNLASLYQAQGAYLKAESLYVRALDIREKALGRMHSDVAKSVDNLASLYQAQGVYAKAEPLYVRALEINEKALGAMPSNVAKNLNNLASLYQAQGAYAKAEPLVERAADIQEDQLRHELAPLSESRKRALMMLLQEDTEGVVSLQADAMPANSQALELALTTVLRRKGRVLDSLAENQASLLAHLSPALRGTFQQLSDADTELSVQLRAPFDPHKAMNRTAAIADLRAHIDDLQATLNAASAELRVRSELVTVAKIQAALPHGAALVEFVRYHRFDPRTVPARQEAHYVAYLLSRQGPQWVALGEAAPIDAGIDAVLAAMHKGTSVGMAKLALRHLDALVFAPIRGRLTGACHQQDKLLHVVMRDIVPVGYAEQAVVGDSGSLTEPATTLARGSPIARKQVKVLFFAANADKDRLLSVGEEHDAIDASLRASRHRDRFQLIARLAGRLSDLQQALLDHSPDIVHFACHGSAQAELLLMQDGGEAAPVPAAALSETLRVLKDNLILVVFNACFSSTQAAAIRESVGLAIGMAWPIEDRAAIKFAAALYRGLASGRPVQDAFDLGAAAIQASSSSDPMPRLSAGKGIDARKMCLVESSARSRWRWLLLAAGCVALAPAVVPWLRQGSDEPPPPPGMVRFAAANIRLGVFAAGLRPKECSARPASDKDCPEPAHPELVGETHMEAFDLDWQEVTNGEFAAWLNANIGLWRLGNDGIVTTRRAPAIQLIRTTRCGDGLTVTSEGRAQVTAESARWPVVCVAWHGADEYCRAQGKRLPLEVEWELAAKGAENRPFPWGDDPPRQDGVAFDLRDGAQVHPRAVGDSPQDVSPDGVHDLGGNVAEWVEDQRGDLAQKTLRGGSFASRGPCYLLTSSCARAAGDSYHKDLGFRCVRSVIDRPQEERGS